MTSRAASPINVSRSALTVGRLCGCPMKRLFTKPPSRRKSLGPSMTSSGTACCFEYVRAAEMQRLAALLPAEGPRAQHVSATERILDQLVGALPAAEQPRPPAPQHRRQDDEGEDEAGHQQERSHELVPVRAYRERAEE